MDVFAGSGALGLEAISRGAGYCLFVEREPRALAAIRANTEHFGLGADQARIHRFDATKLKIAPANRPAPFSHVFMDPPYNRGLSLPVLRRLPRYLAPGAVVVMEDSAEAELVLSGWQVREDRVWGAARVVFLQAE